MPARTPSVIRGRELLRVVVLSGLAGASAVDYHGRPLSDWGVLTTDYENGVEGCECLTDAMSLLGETAPEMLAPNPTARCVGFSDGLNCLGETYGLQGCMAYDDYALFGVANVSRACARPGDTLEYCTRGFCYVDARTCLSRVTHPAEYLLNGRPIPRSSQLHYSYETCGHIDYFTQQHHHDMQGAPLRVTAPITLSPTMHLLQGQGGTWQGPSWSFVQAMAEDLNYSLQVVPLTEESFVRNPMRNSWWACIHMVAINETDLCVGDFRATAGRSRYMSPGAGFTSAVSYASLVLVTKDGSEQQPEEIGWDFHSNPLQPFTNELWGAIFAAFVLTSVAYSLAENVAAYQRWQIRERDSTDNKETHEGTLGVLKAAVKGANDVVKLDQLIDEIGEDARRSASKVKEGVQELNQKKKGFMKAMIMKDEEEADMNAAALAQQHAKEPHDPSPPGSHLDLKDLHKLKKNLTTVTTKSLTQVVNLHDLIKSWVWTGTFAAKTQDMDKASSTLGDSMYVAVQSILPTAGAGYVPRSHGGRIIKFGFCIFVLLTKQFWGSLITTELVFMSVSGSSAVNNLNDATFQGDRICISEEQLALDITAGEISPNPTSHWDTEKVASLLILEQDRGANSMDTLGSLKSMNDGICMHSIEDLDSFRQAVNSDNSHCNKGIRGPPITVDTPIAYPVRMEYIPQLSLWIVQHQQLYQELLQTQVDSLRIPCELFLDQRASTAGELGIGVEQWQVQQMATEFTILLFCCIAGVLVSFWYPERTHGMSTSFNPKFDQIADLQKRTEKTGTNSKDNPMYVDAAHARDSATGEDDNGDPMSLYA